MAKTKAPKTGAAGNETPAMPAADPRIAEEVRRFMEGQQQRIEEDDERNPVLPSIRANAAGCADIVLERFFTKNGFWQLVYYRGNWYANYKSRWELRSDASITSYVDDRLRRCRTVDREGEVIEFPVSTGTVTEITNRIQARVTISDELAAPIRRVDDKWVQVNPTGKAFFRNQIVSMLTGEVESTAGLFYPGGVDFDHDPEAASPEWDKFLDEIFEGHEEDRALIAQWAGCVLSADGRHQKAMLMEGPPRAGKGLIGHVLTELVGEDFCAFPTLQDLSKDFGLQQLLDKKFLLSSDVRLSSRTDSMAVIEKILKITGNDRLSVGRKHTSAIQAKLNVRVMLLANSLPRMTDDTKAFFSRFLIIRLHKSFLDNEDTTLLDKFKAELPGIALWAMDGYRDLVAKGAFSEPKSSRDIRDDWYKNSNTMEQFIDDCFTVIDITDKHLSHSDDEFTSSEQIFSDYKTWTDEQKIQKPLTKNWLIRQLNDALSGRVGVEVGKKGNENIRGIWGLKRQG